MIYTIQNEYIKVEVNSIGAEIWSIIHKKNNYEYLWQGDPKYWEGRSPLLFPIVGKLTNDTYYLDDKEYNLPIHGFAMSKNFKIINYDSNEIILQLLSDENSFEQYPFHFKLLVSYRLLKNKLVIEWKVFNMNQYPIYFSIGGHPGFNTHLTNNRLEDFYLDFGKQLTLETRLVNMNTLQISNEYKKIVENENILKLDDSLFSNNALIFSNIDEVTLRNVINNNYLKVTFKNFPFIAFWTPKTQEKAPFICIEPWYGIGDTMGLPRDLRDKEGILKLSNNEQFMTQYEIEVG